MLDVKSNPGASAEEIATYMHDMTQELARLADRLGFDFLAYLLAMAADEAGAVADTEAEARTHQRRNVGIG
jgi:hypothetical protein